MFDLLLPKRSILSICLIVLSQLGRAQTASDFTGNWVMKLGTKTFLVLTISPQKDSLSGFLVRPRKFQTSDGVSFSEISNSVIREPISRSEIKDGRFVITVQNPADKLDSDSYELSLADGTHLKLKMAGIPLDPLILTRTQESLVPANDWEKSKSYSVEDPAVSSLEMQRIFEEDQKVRQAGVKIDWVVVSRADDERREATRNLMNDGKLHTGEDFEWAAFVFQHGSTPSDYLLAHALALIALQKGQNSALWIATATLDRYLQSIHQPQVFGTQYLTKPNEPTTQDPYDRNLISDALRRQLGVPSQAAQEDRRRQLDEERKTER